VEQFLVSARKYRPDTFATVVGQAHITNTLRNALKMNTLAHAFLFTGPRGVGKTTCARILAKAINCEHLTESGEPCNACNSCRTFIENRSMNIHEMDAASNNSVDDIRSIVEQVRYSPAGGGKSIYIIDEVHMLSTAAFNAFLKTLEEPPPHAIFILATTEKQKILPTILSRCQKFDFRRIRLDDISQHLKDICEQEGISYEYGGLQQIAIKADGALRDALSLFDQIVSFSNRQVTFDIVLDNLNLLDHTYFFRLTDAILKEDPAESLVIFNEIIDNGFDLYNVLSGLVEHFRNLLVARDSRTAAFMETSDNVRETYLEYAGRMDATLLFNAFNLCSESELKFKNTGNPRLLIELLLLKLSSLKRVIHLQTSDLLASGGQKKNN